jgi:hypothetical protein
VVAIMILLITFKNKNEQNKRIQDALFYSVWAQGGAAAAPSNFHLFIEKV